LKFKFKKRYKEFRGFSKPLIFVLLNTKSVQTFLSFLLLLPRLLTPSRGFATWIASFTACF